MRWPSGEDWSAYLVRYIDDHPNLQPRVGPHKGYVNDAGFEHVTCKTCGNVAVWPPGLEDVACTTPGHYLIRDDNDRVVDDICPEA